MKWFLNRLQPIGIIAASLLISFITYKYGLSVLTSYNADIGKLAIDKAPAGVTGADLIANLLTISALTISGCFAYICLPSDRVEVRVASFVKVCLHKSLFKEDDLLKYCDETPDADLTPSCRTLRGLLAPRNGLGGWHQLEEGDLKSTFGENDWKTISRFVDKHLDQRWMILLSAALSSAMLLGGFALFLRYVGAEKNFYSPFEASVIILLLSLNLGIAVTSVTLYFGSSNGQRAVRDRIPGCITEAARHVKVWQAGRRDDSVADLASDAARVTETLKHAADEGRRPKPSRNWGTTG